MNIDSIREYCNSYKMIFSKLTRKAQAELGAAEKGVPRKKK